MERTIRSPSVLTLMVLTVIVAACGSSPTTPSPTRGQVIGLQSLTVGSTAGGVVLHRDESTTGTVTSTLPPVRAERS